MRALLNTNHQTARTEEVKDAEKDEEGGEGRRKQVEEE